MMHSQFLWATFFSTSLSSEWKVSYKHLTKISPLLVKTDHAKKSVSLLFVISPQVLKSHNEVCPQPSLLQNEQANLPQTFFIAEVLQRPTPDAKFYVISGKGVQVSGELQSRPYLYLKFNYSIIHFAATLNYLSSITSN